jgi:hypothetical protein
LQGIIDAIVSPESPPDATVVLPQPTSDDAVVLAKVPEEAVASAQAPTDLPASTGGTESQALDKTTNENEEGGLIETGV